MLKRMNIPHNVLNAKNHQSEAEIVALAGQQGSVTVATNMAGRGTDIKLGAGVSELGGLHVIGSSRHDSRRIDRQLRGRCSRQGDPGSSKFYVSLEDNLMRLFGSDRIVKIFDRFGIEEGEELQHPWLNKSIETAQRRVEQHHFSVRKRTLEFDDVMNKQREILYGLRKDALMSEKPQEVLFEIVEQVVNDVVLEAATPPPTEDKTENQTFNWEHLLGWLHVTFPVSFTREELSEYVPKDMLDSPEPLTLAIIDKVEKAYQRKNADMEEEQRIWLERHTVLEPIDRLWQEHLYAMDHLRSSIYLRAIAQKDPLVEYKNEAFKEFDSLMQRIYREATGNMFLATIRSLESFEDMLEHMPQEMIHEVFGQFGDADYTPELEESYGYEFEEGNGGAYEDIQVTYRRDLPKVGRNDQCPCGSGRKYKKCCGK
jgi:preprotein translocase subunit SecA